MSTNPLTPTQHFILAAAIQHTQGRVERFPDNIKGGARAKVLDGLFNRALITRNGEGWSVAAEGYDALGVPRPEIKNPRISAFVAKLDAVIAAAEGATAPDANPAPDVDIESDVATAEASFTGPAPRTRENSKQAEVIRMLQRPEGATIRQICDATGWQQHTVRGTFAGAFKKKLGMTLTSEKVPGAERIYRAA
jgi:hypothetical protein